MTRLTHAKRIFMASTRQQLLRDLADFCEVNAVDGPVTVDYDLASGQYMATIFYLPQFAEAVELTQNLGEVFRRVPVA